MLVGSGELLGWFTKFLDGETSNDQGGIRRPEEVTCGWTDSSGTNCEKSLSHVLMHPKGHPLLRKN